MTPYAARDGYPAPLVGHDSMRMQAALAIMLLSILAISNLWASPARAARDIADMPDPCTLAATQAAQESGVPFEVLMAVSLTETGRRLDGRMTTWPWTVNMEGEGHWFDDRAAAMAYVADRHANGARSYDIGCFQINRRWHGQAFDSIEAMFDPVTNARYAAEFLSRLHDELGDWTLAAGAFHSRTEKHASKYRTAFGRNLAVAMATTPATNIPAARRVTQAGIWHAALPLVTLQSRPAALGSLMRTGNAARPLFVLGGN